MDTNANSKLVAAILADARNGTFTGIVTQKKGEVKGGVRYGDDTVHAVILTGFRYDKLVKRSLDALAVIDANDVMAKCVAHGFPVTLVDVEQARAELKDSFEKTLAGTNTSTTDAVFEPLLVGGEPVRGSRVYKCVKDKVDPTTNVPYECKCFDCTGDAKAPKDGTIYIQGLKIWQTVLVPAVNGPIPASKPRSMVTPAKDELRKRLPVARYVSFALPQGEDWLLSAGGTAALEATNKGFIATPEVIDLLQRAA